MPSGTVGYRPEALREDEHARFRRKDTRRDPWSATDADLSVQRPAPCPRLSEKKRRELAERGITISESAWRDRLVITAAHCLRRLPEGFQIGNPAERTNGRILAALGTEPNVAAECVFVDLVNDVAVLAAPDYELFEDEADAYEALVDSAEPLAVEAADTPPDEPQRVWLLALDGAWFEATARHFGGPWSLDKRQHTVDGGMSGLPILDDFGKAIGLVTTIQFHPRLCYHLSAGLLGQLSPHEA